MSGYSFRWGIDELDRAQGGLNVPGFMLRNYAAAGVTRNEFLCIMHLAAFKYESPNGQSSPSMGTIAELMGYAHENSVRNLIGSLEDKGMVTVTNRPGYTSVYDFQKFARLMLDMDIKSTPTPTCGGTSESGGGVHPNVPEEKEKRKDNNNSSATELISRFEQKTAFPPPHDSTDAYGDKWEKPFATILAQVDGDIEQAWKYAEGAIEVLWSKGYRFTNPAGILKAALNDIHHDKHGSSANGSGDKQNDKYHDLNSFIIPYARGGKDWRDIPTNTQQLIRTMVGGGGPEDLRRLRYSDTDLRVKYHEARKRIPA